MADDLVIANRGLHTITAVQILQMAKSQQTGHRYPATMAIIKGKLNGVSQQVV